MNADVFERLASERRAGRTVVLATAVRTQGTPPAQPGNRALLDAGGRLLAGTIGCNGLDRRTGADGHALLAAAERTGTRSYTSFDGAPGEGTVEVFLEVFRAPTRVLVGSAGPVADALEALADVVGVAVEVHEPADVDFADAAATLGPGDAAVFVNHDAPELLAAVLAALAQGCSYVGLMGSRRHAPPILAALREAGADMAAVHSPTGLDLGARSPAEIALSILAEVLAVIHGRAGGAMDLERHGAPGG